MGRKYEGVMKVHQVGPEDPGQSPAPILHPGAHTVRIPSFVHPFPGGPHRSQRGSSPTLSQAPALTLSNMNLFIL